MVAHTSTVTIGEVDDPLVNAWLLITCDKIWKRGTKSLHWYTCMAC